MLSNKTVYIFIDNTAYEEDKEIGYVIKDMISSLNIDFPFHVETFLDLNDTYNKEHDPNNEANTLSALRRASIVIPIISTNYVNYTTRDTDRAINKIIDSKDRYLFPLILDDTDWSNIDWMIKSQVTPENAQPFLSLTDKEKQRTLSKLVNIIKETIRDLHSIKTAPQDNSLNNLSDRFVFISHDHDDADFAELLKLKLEREGINSWLDSERLKIGQDWREEIDHSIEKSIAVIVIMTPEARKSEYVTYEWAFAWGKKIKIFPIMLKQTQLHPRLESLQYLNFTNNPARPWNDLISSIKAVINSTSS
jgi:hypothetical protein